MKSRLSLPFAYTFLVAGQMALFAQTNTYDVERDFSIAANPNGAWSYGWKSTLTGNFTLLPVARSYTNGVVPMNDWVLADNQIPQVLHNASSNLTWSYVEGDILPGAVWMTAGFNGSAQNFCVVRFTVPSQNGGRFSLATTGASGSSVRDSDFHVVMNGTEVFGMFLPPSGRTGYTNEFYLNPGDTVDFMAGRGADEDQYGSFLALKATLSWSSVCTPHKAVATAQVVNGFVVGATIIDSGCGYSNAPLVVIQGGGGTGAAATAIVVDGRVTAINFASAGCCYTNTPLIVIGSPPFVPKLKISVSKVKVSQNVVLGRHYVLESSRDLNTWTQALPPFTAESETIENEFDVDLTGHFFRIRETP